MDLEKSTNTSILIWLIFTTRSAPCGRKKVTRRLIEWDPVSEKLVYVFPLEHKKAVPDEKYLNGRPYKRVHELTPNPISSRQFIEQCESVGVIPNGVTIS